VGDARFLLRCRGVDIAKELDEILLGPIRAIDEGQDTDEQRKKRDEREEDLVRDGAREEGAIVVREALDDRPGARKRAG
jgi:hypothetical protein